ncbi:MAG: hypothetical protein PUJ82_13975 [Spirochaetales bacterium]|nr:hypothetical protein [Spirochaetales bacterium]MDY5914639.1 hypothetical protein [Treponema sp.]
MTKLELTTIQNGLAVEMFNEELKKVLANIEDENTNAKTTRKITLCVEFKPDADRKLGTAKVSVKANLAPIIPHEKAIFFDYDDDNEFAAFEDDPEQLDKDWKEAMNEAS